MTDMGLSEVRRRTTGAVLRSAIAARGVCPATGEALLRTSHGAGE